jgi:hypothetical protein
MERKQTKQIKTLLEEYKALKSKIFASSSFVIGEGQEMQRYSQLLGFFFPQYRTKGYTSPLEEQN